MSSHAQGIIKHLSLSARAIKMAINLWPPFIGAGIRVQYISKDFREARVALRLKWFNRNYFGTHFGGSLFAMTDPFYALLMLHNLGHRYTVWDKASRIEYKKPGRGIVYADFQIDDKMIDEVLLHTANGDKFEPTYAVDIVDRQGDVVARVEKTLYIRKTPSAS